MPLANRLGGEGFRHRRYFYDDFNRTNRSLNPAAPYYGTAMDQCTITGTQPVFDAGTNGSWQYWTAVHVETGANGQHPDQFAEIELQSDLAGDIAGVFCRGDSSNQNFYIGRCSRVGADTYEVYKRVGGTYTLLASLAETFPAAPFSIRFEVWGASVPVLRLLVGNGCQWVQKVSTTDAASAHTSGRPGFFGQRVAGNVTVDNFACGRLGG